MADFLNRQNFVEAIIRILRDAEKEVILVVPYIKLSPRIWEELIESEKRLLKVLIVYREDKLAGKELDKLLSLSNITLMQHEHLHAKCYLNEQSMIIGSMNLYEYSELNNREMGVYLSIHDDFGAYREALEEIKVIIQTSALVRKSDTLERSIKSFDLFKKEDELLQPFLHCINDLFDYKSFSLRVAPPSGFGNFSDNYSYRIVSNPFLEDISVEIEYVHSISNSKDSMNGFYPKRFVIRFDFDLNVLKIYRATFWDLFNEETRDKYQVYWDHEKAAMTIYPNKLHPIWSEADTKKALEYLKSGLDYLLDTFNRARKNVKGKSRGGF